MVAKVVSEIQEKQFVVAEEDTGDSVKRKRYRVSLKSAPTFNGHGPKSHEGHRTSPPRFVYLVQHDPISL